MNASNFYLLTNNVLTQVFPTRETYAENITPRRTERSTLTGETARATIRSVQDITVAAELRFVSSALACAVTSAWLAREPVRWIENYSLGSMRYVDALVINQQSPAQTPEAGRPDLWLVSLLLRAYAGVGVKSGAFFLCDDPYLGLLDQTYNPLIG